MAKDPAFLFYSGDFLNGVIDLTMEERGQYISLLCLQHQKGHLPEKTIRLSVGSVSVSVLSKFKQDEQGLFFNERLEKVVLERENFLKSRRENGLKGGRPSKRKKPKRNLSETYTKANHKAKTNLREDINEDEIKDEKGKEDLKEETLLKVSDAAKKLEIELPWNTETFEQAWEAWLRFRWVTHKFKYKSEESLTAALKHLSEISEGQEITAIAIIQHSMANQWSGLFELKTQSTQKNGKSRQFNVNKIKSLLERDFGG